MFFLFGWGRVTRNDSGPTMPVKCPNCKNDNYWHLVHIREWFTLFFIPVIPYANNHLLLCPICNYGTRLAGADLEKAKQMNLATAAYLGKQLSEESYAAAVSAFRLTS